MLTYTIRRLAMAVPTLLLIALVIFALLELAPGDPMAQMPLTVSDTVRAEMRAALGLGEPAPARFAAWLWQVFAVEPRVLLDTVLGTNLAEGLPRVQSWQSRSPVFSVIAERLPQTLWVVGMAYVIGILAALPIGIWSACRRHSPVDHAATAVTMLGYAVPPFFSGLLAILVFTYWLGWFPSVYDTTYRVTGWAGLRFQLWQMTLPVLVLSVQTTAMLARYLRAAMIDELQSLYVRAARAKGMGEAAVVLGHALRNAMIPVVTIVALGLPQVFGGAIITEQIFRVNGVGHLLITSIQASDWPMVQTVTFLLAILIVGFNILADLLYGWLDPRVRHD